MISLNQWFSKNTKYPLLGVALIVGLVQIGFLIYTQNENLKSQDKAIRNLVTTIANIAIEQGNRPLLESSFQLAVEDLGVESILLCEKDKPLFSLPLRFGDCTDPKKADFLTARTVVTPSGFKDYKFYFYSKKFDAKYSVLILNLSVFLLVGIGFLLIYRTQRKLKEDIFKPLENHLLSDSDLKIKELSEIRDAYLKHLEAKESQAAATALLEHNLDISHNVESIKLSIEGLVKSNFGTDKEKANISLLAKDLKAIMVKIAEQTPEADKVKLMTSDESFLDYLHRQNEKVTKANLKDLLEIAIERKHVELKKTGKNVQIELSISKDLKGKFSEIVGPELRSILSNMMNNSIEAEATKIKIDAYIEDQHAVFKLEDNGNGISEKIQNSIFDRSFTEGKEHGTGYGLFHGPRFVKSWGGDFLLKTSGEGSTVFEIKLPLWEMPDIGIESYSNFVILDDEDAIHKKWKAKILAQNPAAKITSFKSPEDFCEWFEGLQSFAGYRFYIDSDLGLETTGEQVIDELGINTMSYLVTNNYDSAQLAGWCKEREIRLVPKSAVLS
jgi:signal transduction histidine kinase